MPETDEFVTGDRVMLTTGMYKDKHRHGVIAGETPKGRYVWVRWDDNGKETQCPRDYLTREEA